MAASWLHLLRVSPALHPPERPSPHSYPETRFRMEEARGECECFSAVPQLFYCTTVLIDWILTQANAKNPARGHKVEKHHSEGKNVRRSLHSNEKGAMAQKNTRKNSNITKEKKKERNTCGYIGAPAYRRTIERRAAASTKT